MFPAWRSLPAKQNRLAVGKDQRAAQRHGLSSGRADDPDRSVRGKNGICDGPGRGEKKRGRGPSPRPARKAAKSGRLTPAGEAGFATAPPDEIPEIALPGPDVLSDLVQNLDFRPAFRTNEEVVDQGFPLPVRKLIPEELRQRLRTRTRGPSAVRLPLFVMRFVHCLPMLRRGRISAAP